MAEYGQHTIAGGQTSALVTQELNGMFDDLYKRTNINLVQQGSALIDGIKYYYRVWSNNFCETWFSISGTMPPEGSGEYYSLDTQNFYIYETPKVNYPTSIINFSSSTPPSEICEVTCRIAIIKTTARSGNGYNTTTQSASYGLGRFDVTQLYGAEYKLNFYVCGQGTYVGA